MSKLKDEIDAGTISLDSIPDSLDSKDEVADKVNARRHALAIEFAAKLIADYHAKVGHSLTSLVEVKRSEIPYQVEHDIKTILRKKGWDMGIKGNGTYWISPNYKPGFRETGSDAGFV